jgi:hypothetical protein
MMTRRDIVAVSTKSDLSLYEESYDRWLEISAKAMDQFDLMMTLGIRPVALSAIKKSIAGGACSISCQSASNVILTTFLPNTGVYS